MNEICKRAKQLDKVIEEKSRKAPVSHIHKLMLTKDEENGYTPLHYAILQRDLTSLLLLLKHASTEIEDENSVAHGHTQQDMQHPLRLLGCNGDDEGISRTMKDLAASLDNEALTPLRLLGATSANDLEKCRQTMHWSYLKQIWKKQTQTYDDRNVQENNPRTYRQRMISFGDERDYINNDVDNNPVNNSFDRRSRGGSFHVDDLDHDDDDDDEYEEVGADTDLLPLGEADFTLLVGSDGLKACSECEVLTVGDGSAEYGCELYTFGRTDHCASGVPIFGNACKRDKLLDVNDKRSIEDKDSASHKPRRVEAFALGGMRREWSDPKASTLKDKNTVDSPIVAVAAAAHHTLAVTRSGRLFAFGLGKGGRLGTGDENHRPLPTRVLGPLAKRIVTSIAAAENHSLCVTAFDGGCYAFGSNGFGQLGMPSEQDFNSRLTPRRVDDLKSEFVVAVAAGDRHSVALTKTGDVYCWGDNKAGQCARSSPNSPSISTTRSCHQPMRVDALADRICIAICASEFSTIVLTRPPTNSEASLASLPVNLIYGWGHGSHIPSKVNFPSESNNQCSMQDGLSTFSRTTCVNPVSIASAKYHSVAVTADGRVFTWGISSESLGLEQLGSRKGNISSPKGKCQFQSSGIASPQLVVGMLPEKGGGRVVSASASENHTAVITADGHLYTWGSTYGNNTLGHKGVKWQPSPRKVKRVHRAVGLAAAKEHTCILVGTSFPSLPHPYTTPENIAQKPLSLGDNAAVEIARNIDISNVIPVASVARRLNSNSLMSYCQKFIEMNLDGVLSACKMTDLDSFFANTQFFDSPNALNCSGDGFFHPFLYQMALSNEWMLNGTETLKSFKGFMGKKQRIKARVACSIKSKLSGALGSAVLDQSTGNFTTQPLVDRKNDEATRSVEKKMGHNAHTDNDSATAKSSNSGKYFCSVCAVSCPDHDSYTLHMSGKKHRNRLNHARKKEETEIAEQMMKTKRIQQINSNEKIPNVGSLDVSAAVKKSCAWSAQPSANKQSAQSSSVCTKLRSNSLLGIMDEELQNSASSKASTPKFHAAKVKCASSSTSTKMLSFGPQPTQSARTISLGAFIPTSSSHSNELRNAKASWGSTRTVAKSAPAVASNNKVKSFAEIQLEEQTNRKNEDHMCHLGGNKWFVQQRDRAASIGEIQQREQEEAEWQLLVQEQKRIEELIAQECKIEAKKEKGNLKKQRKRRQRNKSAKDTRRAKIPAASEEVKTS